ncbi:MAG: hypothetical protein JXB05_30390 [Myxococcaceae bacterium]|nr:hypothetical protein [Myxococcaceae bacterium]
MRGSATHFAQRTLPPPGHPVQRFFHGLSLPIHLLRALWAEPMARRRYLKVAILQSLAILALGLLFMGSANEAVDEVQKAAERTRLAESTLAPSPPEAVPPPPPLPAAEVKPPRNKTRLTLHPLEFWASLFAAMQLAQWVVIALSRDFHDAVSRDASLLTGIAPEDEELTPRIRIDFQWMRKKLSRRIRALMVFLSGMPVLFMVTAPLPYTGELLAALVPAWSVYWFVVFTASKSARAWDNTQAGDPWFLRGWKWLTTRVPGLRWGFLQRYGLFWTNRTASLFPPASEVEKLPWAFTGLSLMKALAILPIAKSFLRPLFPVASAHLIATQRAASDAPPSEAPAPPAATSASAE